jgi:hypothetical protein
LHFLNIFWKNSKIPNLIKIRPFGAELFYAEGKKDRQTHRQAGRQAGRQTGMKKLIDPFRNFAKND